MEQWKKKLSVRRIVIYLIGLVIYAFGACLMTRAQVGISPLTSVAYIFTRFTPLTLGMTQLIFNVFLILVQAVWMGREFEKVQYFQFVASVFFSIFIDLLMPLTAVFNLKGVSYIGQWVVFVGALLVMALGITILKITDLILLPGDGIANVMAYKINWVFGKAKVLTDSICVVATCVISFVALRHIEGIGLGTVVAALSLGNLARFFIKHLDSPLKKFFKEPVAE